MAKTNTAEKIIDEPNLPAVQDLGVPAEFGDDLGQFAGAGVSDRQEDFQLPFLAIAQGLSPQIKRQQADKYIPGLEEGDIFNTATGQFWKGETGLLVVPAFFQKAMVEWIPRNQGGGYVATHDIDTPLLKECRLVDVGEGKQSLRHKNGHDFVDTSYHFVTLAETGESAVVGMTSTNLGSSRTWQTIQKNIKVPVGGQLIVAPCFSRVFRLRTAYKQKDNNAWFVYSVSDEGWALPLYRAAYEESKKTFVYASEHGAQIGRPPEGINANDTTAGAPDLSGEAPI